MHQLTDKQYDEYQRLCHACDHGQMLTPDGLRLICAGFDYDAEAIGSTCSRRWRSFRPKRIKYRNWQYATESW